LIEAIDWRRSGSGNSFATSHARWFLSRFEEWSSENNLSSLTGEEEAAVNGSRGDWRGWLCLWSVKGEVWMKIERVGGERAVVWKRKQINGLLGLLKGKVMGGGGLLGLYIFFSFLTRTGSVRFGLAGSGTPKPETEPNRTFS
jgi:hypothetical protein